MLKGYGKAGQKEVVARTDWCLALLSVNEATQQAQLKLLLG